MSAGVEPTHVICGPSRFHAISVELTAATHEPTGRALLVEIGTRYGNESLEGRHWSHAARDLSDHVGELADPRVMTSWVLAGIGRRIAAGEWPEGTVVPRCRMIDPGPAVPIAAALERGLTWSLECAKALGLVADGRQPLERAKYPQMVAAYRHAIGCRICTFDGIGRCDTFSALAGVPLEQPARPRARRAIA